MTSFHELRRGSAHGIHAVPYRGRLAGRALRLPDGAIVEAPFPDQRDEVPARVPECFAVGQGGGPATIHHANLGLVAAHLSLTGIYLLPDGDVAAVYGAVAAPIGDEVPSLE